MQVRALSSHLVLWLLLWLELPAVAAALPQVPTTHCLDYWQHAAWGSQGGRGARGQQGCNHVGMPAAGCHTKGAPAPLINYIWRCAGGQQTPHFGRVARLCGVTQGCINIHQECKGLQRRAVTRLCGCNFAERFPGERLVRRSWAVQRRSGGGGGGGGGRQASEQSCS